MLNVLDFQKKFKLFQLEDLVKVTVVSLEETVKVRTSGGVLGFLKTPPILGEVQVGNQIEAKVVSFVHENIPVFEPTLELIINRKPQEAVVKFASPRAIVVVFTDNPQWAGLYEPETMSKEMLSLLPDQKVIASEITCGEDYFKIGRLKKSTEKSEPKKKKDVSASDDWKLEKIKEVMASGSSKMWKSIRLGKIYTGEVYTRSEVVLPGEIHGFINKGLFPNSATQVSVRVIFIDEMSKKITVEYLKCENEDEKKLKQVKTVVHNGIQFNCRDEIVYQDGKNKGSFTKIKGCWLGFTYQTVIKNGLPDLAFVAKRREREREEDAYDLKINVVVKSTISPYQDGDIVYFKVLYMGFINGTGVLPKREAEIHVDILYVEDGNAPKELNKITLNDENINHFKETDD